MHNGSLRSRRGPKPLVNSAKGQLSTVLDLLLTPRILDLNDIDDKMDIDQPAASASKAVAASGDKKPRFEVKKVGISIGPRLDFLRCPDI